MLNVNFIIDLIQLKLVQQYRIMRKSPFTLRFLVEFIEGYIYAHKSGYLIDLTTIMLRRFKHDY